MEAFRRSSIQYEPSQIQDSINAMKNDDHSIENTIRLQLNKPENWNWELTTSKSSPNIAFPRILLYDNKGSLLADACESDCIFKSNDQNDRNKTGTKIVRNSTVSDPGKLSRSSTTTSLSKKKRRLSASNLKQIETTLSDVIDKLSERGIECKINNNLSRKNSDVIKRSYSNMTLEYDEISTAHSENTNLSDISFTNRESTPISTHSEENSIRIDSTLLNDQYLKPCSSSNDVSKLNYKHSARSTPVKEVRFNLQKSQSVLEVPSHRFEREKRKCRRSKSTEPSKFSGSILERMRAFKERSSSSEEHELKISDIDHGPRYYLRSSRAGTLVVCEENLRNKKIRRRPMSFTRISEAEETDSKSNVAEKFIQNKPHKKSLLNGIKKEKTLDDELPLEMNGINEAISEISLNSRKKFSDFSKTLVYANNYNNNDVNDDEMKAKKRKKIKKLRRCMSTGAVVCFSSSSDDDCSQTSSKSANFRSRRKTSSTKKSVKEKGDQILTISNNNSSTTSTVQNLILPSSGDVIDEKSGSDEILMTEIVRRLTTSLKQNTQTNVHTLDNINEKQYFASSASSVSSILPTSLPNQDQKLLIAVETNQHENCNLQLGHCQNTIENIVKNSFNNNNSKNNNNNDNKNNNCNFEENILDNSVTNNNNNLYSIDVDEEYSKICDNNNNNNSDVNDDDNDNDNDKNEYFRNLLNNNDYDCDDSVYVLSETASVTPTSCSDSETVTVVNFNQHYINKNSNNNIKSANDRNNKFILDNNYNYNMGSNVSRNSDKNSGLSGRRTQSSGNLYTGKHSNNTITSTVAACSYSSNSNPNDKFNSTLPPGITTVGVLNGSACKQQQNIPLSTEYNTSKTRHTELIIQTLDNNKVTKKDRNKFCGSLPNHLDVEDKLDDGIQQQLDMITSLDEGEYHQQQQENQQFCIPLAPPRKHYQKHQLQQQQQQQLNLSSNTLSSGVESSITHPSNDSFRSNQARPDIQLKLPLVRSNADPSCDQGYGSERSPEDELPPPMPDLSSSTQFQFLQNYNMDWDYTKCIQNPYCYNFITKDCTFSLQITKGSRGLGLSISGGIDSNSAFPGLIRIKRLFPHQPAWSTGKLQPGDIILEANEVPLTGLTNYEALEVLRTMPNDVVLLICRPNDEEYKKLSPPADPPKPPSRQTQQQGTQTSPEDYPLQPLSPLQTNFTGEFEIIMVKQQGSLGFTLRKEDESILGHYVRALVREPATTDGRIKAGDKIVAVNDVPLSPMTHEQAVIFLRQAADTVKLRLYRDGAQTPVPAVSPTTENKTFCNSSKKTLLRPEAINLLSDLAYKKQTTPGDSTESSLISNNTSPRRLRRANKQNSGNTSQSEHDTSDSKSSSNHQYIVSSQSGSLYSDSEQSINSQCSFRAQPINTIDEIELNKIEISDSVGDKPDRPNFLDLVGPSGNTPVVSRKPRFQFTIATNAHELTNFENVSTNCNDPDAVYSKNSDEKQLTNNDHHEFTSLPCETFLVACKTESDLKDEANFSYKNPIYQSAHVQTSQGDETPMDVTKKEGNSSLLKWKGVVLSPDSENAKKLDIDNKGTNSTDECDTSCTITSDSDPTVIDTQKSVVTKTALSPANVTSSSMNNEGHRIITVELNRGWNSRLGFSLQSDSNTKKTVISAIYSDSVAAKDGRLRVGDQLLTVNDEPVEDMLTSKIIDLLRILRGSIVITVLRKSSSSSLPSSSSS